MSALFVSYKREDELPVGRLVEALRNAGLDPWWDRGLQGGENWRSTLAAKLEEAGCVIVVWSRASTGPAGDFVRDEATLAKSRGILVPVIIERGVKPPLGFGEIQAIDLSHWRGNPRDAFFRDLLGVVRAKLGGTAPPKPLGPSHRLHHRLAASGIVTALAASLVGFGTNILGVQTAACTVPLGQPGLSDVCGALRMGGRPTRDERLAFDALPTGDCAALQTFRIRYESSPLRTLVDSRLNAKITERKEYWVDNQRTLTLYAGGSNETEARDRAQRRAKQLCDGFASTGYFRLVKAEARGQYVCEEGTCGLTGEALCLLQEKRISAVERCGVGRTSSAGPLRNGR